MFLGIWLGFLLNESLERCFWHVHLRGDPREDHGQAGKITSLGWPGEALGYHQRSVKALAGERALWPSLL